MSINDKAAKCDDALYCHLLVMCLPAFAARHPMRPFMFTRRPRLSRTYAQGHTQNVTKSLFSCFLIIMTSLVEPALQIFALNFFSLSSVHGATASCLSTVGECLDVAVLCRQWDSRGTQNLITKLNFLPFKVIKPGAMDRDRGCNDEQIAGSALRFKFPSNAARHCH